MPRKCTGIEPAVPPLARSTVDFEDRARHQSGTHFHRHPRSRWRRSQECDYLSILEPDRRPVIDLPKLADRGGGQTAGAQLLDAGSRVIRMYAQEQPTAGLCIACERCEQLSIAL